MHTYTIMPMFPQHREQICRDILDQYARGIADTALFMIKLVPEGDPPIRKAEIAVQEYDRFRDTLGAAGATCGILVQCTIGHGYPLNRMFPFQRYVNLTDGEEENIVCPFDEAAREYFREQFAILAAHRPSVIMVDDDFRLLNRMGKGCACALHLARFNERAGTNLDRATLYERLRRRKEDGECERLARIFEEVQEESLLGAARAMREGIDRVDPALPGVFCGCGTDPSGEIAHILAGEGNPAVIRVNNGNYTAPGARNLSQVMYRAATQIHLAANRADVYLAETDTCPQNRYSTAAVSLHAHYAATILEGASGAKHWITRLSSFEPESGTAYRDKLAEYAGFYRALAKEVPKLRPFGCRIPLATHVPFDFSTPPYTHAPNGWTNCVLERLGFPMYFGDAGEGAVFMDDETPDLFGDEEIQNMLGGMMILSATAAQKLNERGFSADTGVRVRPWEGKNTAGEYLFESGNTCSVQVGRKELIPCPGAQIDSMVYHVPDGVRHENLFAGSVCFDNPRGGRVITFCGTPSAAFTYTEAFSFLNASRKRQLIRLLREGGHLPLYYPADAEVMLRGAYTEKGELFCAFFNLGLDPLDAVQLCVQTPVRHVERLTKEGKRETLTFREKDGIYRIDVPALTLEPVILFLS